MRCSLFLQGIIGIGSVMGHKLHKSLEISSFDDYCKIPLDLAFLQDSTGSFINDLPNVNRHLPYILQIVDEVLPGSRFAVTDFRDKPYQLLGEGDDWCHKRHTGFSYDSKTVLKAYGQIVADGGADIPEAMFHALLQIAYDRADYDWCSIVGPHMQKRAGECCGRVIIISTDAFPHDVDDYTLYNGADPDFPTPTVTPIPPQYMPPFPDDGLASLSAADWDTICVTNEYPSEDQLVAGLLANKITLMVLVPDDDPKVVERWRSIIARLGEPEGYLQLIANDSKDIVGAMETLFQNLLENTCPYTTTTEYPTETTSSESSEPVTSGSESSEPVTSGSESSEPVTSGSESSNTDSTEVVSSTTDITQSSSLISTSSVSTQSLPPCSPTASPECVWPGANSSQPVPEHEVDLVVVALRIE